MSRAIAVLSVIPCLLAGCGDQTRYPERPVTKATQPDPNDPMVAGRPLSSWVKDLGSSDADTRRSAAAFLGNPGATYAIKPLIGALKDSDAEVRANAATSLRKIGKDKEALVALIAVLHDPDDKVKLAAAGAVMEYRYDATAAVPKLVELWGVSQNNAVKAAAGAALNHIDVEAARKAGVPAP
jgi:HEAT repeat protein